MRTEFISFRADDTLEHILKIFAKNNIISAPVFDGKEFIGTVSDIGIAKYFSPKRFLLMWKKKNQVTAEEIKKVLASTLAKKSSVTLKPDDELQPSLNKITSRPYCIPVFEKKTLVGIVSSEDLTRFFLKELVKDQYQEARAEVNDEFGEKLDADFFPESDKAYLRPLLADLTAYGIGLNDADIAAELTSCLRYLHFTDLPVYQESLQYLLNSQRPDGKWGDYEQYRSYYGDYVNQAFYLHTTLVVVDALTTAFHYRER